VVRLPALPTGRVLPPRNLLVLISVTGWVNPGSMVHSKKLITSLWTETFIYGVEGLQAHLYKCYRVLVDLAVATSFVSRAEDKTSWSRRTTGNTSHSRMCIAFLYRGIPPSTALSLHVQACVFSAKNQYPATMVQRFTGHNHDSAICGLLPHLVWASWDHWRVWRSVSS
jgi:hypothetical protein